MYEGFVPVRVWVRVPGPVDDWGPPGHGAAVHQRHHRLRPVQQERTVCTRSRTGKHLISVKLQQFFFSNLSSICLIFVHITLQHILDI